MDAERDYESVASWEDGTHARTIGRRSESPALCYGCGREMSDADVNVRGAFCSGECESRAGWSQR